MEGLVLGWGVKENKEGSDRSSLIFSSVVLGLESSGSSTVSSSASLPSVHRLMTVLELVFVSTNSGYLGSGLLIF